AKPFVHVRIIQEFDDMRCCYVFADMQAVESDFGSDILILEGGNVPPAVPVNSFLDRYPSPEDSGESSSSDILANTASPSEEVLMIN
ncbi:hypothetical protein FRC06_002843, partial [Ceratobasidium sp. 370]